MSFTITSNLSHMLSIYYEGSTTRDELFHVVRDTMPTKGSTKTKSLALHLGSRLGPSDKGLVKTIITKLKLLRLSRLIHIPTLLHAVTKTKSNMCKNKN